ncbi:MAG: 2-dehydropantoate 2-reductase [Chloroflexi bacterium]|nr:2-dehydropantoate 2-reductase [Chloroflexota bacterium]
MKERSRIAVIGAGAVGSYYGARLAEAGHDVRFLLRRDYEAVHRGGLKITSPDGDLTLADPFVARSSADIGPVDWVLCALKATSAGEARALLRPCVTPDTRILLLMNGLGLEELFAGWFRPGRVFGGMAFTCINRGEPGSVHHLAYGPVTIGHFRNDPRELETALALWQGSKVKVSASPSLKRARWEKLCWNIPFSGLCVAAGGVATDRIVGDAGLRAEARALMEEVIRAGNADLAAGAESARLDGEGIVSRMFAATDEMGAYRPSLMIDFVEGRSMEVEAMFGEPLRRALALDVDAPRLRLLTSLLRALNTHSDRQ